MAPRFEIVSYYLYTKNTGNFCTGNTEASHAPPPPNGGRVGARGAIISHEICFLREPKKGNPDKRSPSRAGKSCPLPVLRRLFFSCFSRHAAPDHEAGLLDQVVRGRKPDNNDTDPDQFIPSAAAGSSRITFRAIAMIARSMTTSTWITFSVIYAFIVSSSSTMMSTSRNEPRHRPVRRFQQPLRQVGQASINSADQFTDRKDEHCSEQDDEERIDHAFKLVRYIQASSVTSEGSGPVVRGRITGPRHRSRSLRAASRRHFWPSPRCR